MKSRMGKKPIVIPDGVTASQENGVITISGPKGTLTRAIRDNIIRIAIEESTITLEPVKKSIEASQLWGTYASHIRNMITGVTEGFEKKLEVEGIGYRADMQGQNLVLNVGYSHPVEITPEEDISFQVEKNAITVSGIDKEKVGDTAARIRAVRPPEPYKGKGVRYADEIVRRKAGKKAVGTGE